MNRSCFVIMKKAAFVIVSQEIHDTSGRSATLWTSKHQIFKKTETIIKGRIKVCFAFVRAAQNSRYLISFYYFHFSFYLFFLRPYFEKHLDFCSLLYRLRDSSAAGAGTEKTIFSHRYPLFLDRVFLNRFGPFILPRRPYSEILLSIPVSSTWMIENKLKISN